MNFVVVSQWRNRISLMAGSLFVLCYLLSASSLHAVDADLDAANRAYIDEHYEQSAALFQKIIDSRGYSASLCFDLANAQTKAGHVGDALLNYERARYLAPGDHDIDHNLQRARKLAGLAPNSYRWWEIALRGIDWSVWLVIMGIVLVLLFIAVIGSAYTSAIAASTKLPPRLVRNTFRGILFGGIPIFFLLGYIELATIGFNYRIEGVIVAPKEATLRLSPFDSADSTGTVPEGELVTVEARHDNYLRIEARDHHFGWIRDSDLQPIIAGSFDVKPGN